MATEHRTDTHAKVQVRSRLVVVNAMRWTFTYESKEVQELADYNWNNT